MHGIPHDSLSSCQLEQEKLSIINGLGQASATYGTHAKRGTCNDFQWHAE